MAEEVGIRALQQHASAAVRRAAEGETLVITDRGRPVARLVPITASPIEQLLAEGLARVATRDPRDLPPPLPALVGPSLSELLEEERRHAR
jgi:prevent-host-death family protein